MNKHAKLCVADSSESDKKTLSVKNSRMFLASALAMDAKCEDFSTRIISRMLDDEMTNIVKNDELLMLYGYTLYEMGGEESFSQISNKLRNVSRLLIKFRETNDVSITTAGLIDPSHWDAIIAAVKSLVKRGGIENVGIPSLLLRLGRSLEALASAKRMLGIKTKNDNIVNDARKCLELHAEEWGTYSKHALATIQAKNDRKPELLPLTKDIQNLRSFLVTEINRIIDQLENRGKEGQCHVSQSEFSYLQKLCLVRLITFNARRGGEASKIKLEQWINSDKWKREEDIENIEDPMERLLAERLKIIYSKGKKSTNSVYHRIK